MHSLVFSDDMLAYYSEIDDDEGEGEEEAPSEGVAGTKPASPAKGKGKKGKKGGTRFESDGRWTVHGND